MHDDAELQDFREGVNCAAVLDRMGGWRLDQCQGTRRALKYRRGEGEILIINHDGRGWLDPTSQAKGDVFGLVQHFNPSLNFGQVRQALRHLVGIAPSFPTASRNRTGERDNRPVLERWAARPPLRPGSAAWRYLADERCIPPETLAAAVRLDAAREGYRGSAWFAHRRRGEVCHVEARGPDRKGSLAGGTKDLFHFRTYGLAIRRVAITEAPIDALSIAALEQAPADTLYVATGGGMGPATIAALQSLLSRLASSPDALFAIATDANHAGDR